MSGRRPAARRPRIAAGEHLPDGEFPEDDRAAVLCPLYHPGLAPRPDGHPGRLDIQAPVPGDVHEYRVGDALPVIGVRDERDWRAAALAPGRFRERNLAVHHAASWSESASACAWRRW